MIAVVKLKVLENYHIWMCFSDNTEKIINFLPFIGQGFTAQLLNYENFKKVKVEPGGGITWDNGYDFCPNYLKELKGIHNRKVADSTKQVSHKAKSRGLMP